MLHSLKSLAGFEMTTPDGARARLREFYLDERCWVVRHLVAELEQGAEAGRCVLVPPEAVRDVDRVHHAIVLSWWRHDLERAPDAATDPPVGRQRIVEPAGHEDTSLWGLLDFPLGGTVPPFGPVGEPPVFSPPPVAGPPMAEPADLHLHGSDDLDSFRARAVDGEIGRLDDVLLDARLHHVERFVVVPDDDAWVMRVHLPAAWVERLDVGACSALLKVGRAAVRGSPAYTGDDRDTAGGAQDARPQSPRGP